jgi:hypothetical protein
VTNSVSRMAVAIYRFFASLKLAVLSLITLASVLAYATFFESRHGTHAAQEWIYRSPAFAFLLAALGANVLCAALIRFRWDDRQKGWARWQTGFVITHAGLLVVLLGSWITLQTSDEGQVMLLENETTDQMVRTDHSVIRVQALDPKTGEPQRGQELELPFRPGAFSWGSPAGVVRQDVLTEHGDPVRLVVKGYLAASSPPVWVEDARAPGRLKKIYAPFDLPGNQADAGIPACLIELQVDNDRRELWLRRKDDIDDPLFEDLVVGGHPYRLAFDFERRSIDFDLTLVDFAMGTDPGTQAASTYTSRVVVNDRGHGVEDKAATITMNEPLWYRGKTFYQQSYRELRDARTGRKTGYKKSVLQVGIDPFWGVKYAGCLTVVLGMFVQFAMRAGVFSASRTREQAAGCQVNG